VATLWQIFATFAKIGAFTIGGGYAMIPLIKDELVKRGWLSEEELPDIIALAQSAPGVLAVNMSIFAGHRLRGVKGSIAATLGSVLPAFLTILLIAMLFKGYQDNQVVIRIFKGIRPVVVSLIAVPQFVILFALYLLAGIIVPLTNPSMINDFKACGGFIMLATGFRMVKLLDFPIADMIPAMVLVMPFSALWARLF
jgi:chromate transport protein ChrA